MTLQRLPVPVGANLVELKAYLERTFTEVSNLFVAHAEVIRDLTAMRLIDGVGSRWLWDDTGITEIDPGAGHIRADSTNLITVTELYISKTDAFDRVVMDGGDSDTIGQPFVLNSMSSNAFIIGIISAQVDQGDWMTWEITPTQSAGNPQQSELMEFRWYPSEAVLSALSVSLSAAIDNILKAASRLGDL